MIWIGSDEISSRLRRPKLLQRIFCWGKERCVLMRVVLTDLKLDHSTWSSVYSLSRALGGDQAAFESPLRQIVEAQVPEG